MKKSTFLCAMWLFASMSIAQVNGHWGSEQSFKVSPKATTESASSEIESQLVLEEDFSLCTAGTPETPDTTNIAPGTNYIYKINPGYTHTPEWRGYHVYQAGGCVALGEYDYYGYKYGGYISTPETELYGEATVSFRARRAGTSPDAGNLDLALCDNMQGRMEDTTFELTSEWQEFTWTSSKASFNDKNIFQFTTQGGTILLDDIKVTRVRNRIPNVYANMAINNSSTEFVANWERSTLPTADGYLLTVWYKQMPETQESGSVSYDFESINVKADGQSIDTLNPGYPEGWSIDVSSNGEKDMCTTAGDFNSGKQAIHFDAEGDYILTPETPAPINKISFWVKPSSMESESYYFSLVGVQVKDIYGEWEPIANLPNYWMYENGGYYTFEGDQVGNYITQVRFTCEGSYGITFAIDDITLEYETQPLPTTLFADKFVADTFCVVSDIDPTKEHYYNVKVKEGNLVSDPSYDIWVDGINGLTPLALPATEVTSNSFTANWEKNHNAGTYKVSFVQTVTTTSENQEVVVISEDFSGITDGTLDNPGFSWDLVHNLCENGQSTYDWLLTYPRWVEGMAGSQGPNTWSGGAGLVLSPKLKLGNNAVKVSFKAYNKVAGDRIWVIAVDDYNATQAVIGVPVAFSTTESGYITETVVLNPADHGFAFGETPLHIGFMSEQGEFYVDDITISLIVPTAGTVVEIPFKSLEVTETSYTLTDLPAGITDYAYNVVVKRTKDFLDYVSNYSNTVYVTLPGSGVEDISVDEAKQTLKVISNGQLLILRDGKTYNVLGTKL